jgi:hypothetical protein
VAEAPPWLAELSEAPDLERDQITTSVLDAAPDAVDLRSDAAAVVAGLLGRTRGDVARGEIFDAAIIMLDRFGNRAVTYENTISLTYSDPAVAGPGENTFPRGVSGIAILAGLS